MIYDLSNIDQKSQLAGQSTLHRAFELAIAEVAEEIISGTYNPFDGFVAENKMKGQALDIYRRGVPEVTPRMCKVFLAAFDSGQVDDETLTQEPTFTQLKNACRTWFKYYSGVSAADETTAQ